MTEQNTQLILGKTVISSDFPDYITVRSSGAASKKHPSSMGRYRLETTKTLQGRPVYRKTDKDFYIFYNSEDSIDNPDVL